MNIDEWIIREAIDTLHQANITLLGITGIDFPEEIAKEVAEEVSSCIINQIKNNYEND